ncbi:MAG TPA: hypothetical protein PLZ05_00860 [Alphaproteobacteria bacterium]|nr:hypothetical protein [Alphaproteobacteria bacterium]
MLINKITYLVDPTKVSSYYMQEKYTTFPVIEINGVPKVGISKNFPNPNAWVMVQYRNASEEVIGERLSRTITEYYTDNNFNKKPLFYLFPNSNIDFSEPSIISEQEINNIIIRSELEILQKYLDKDTFIDFNKQYRKILNTKIEYLNRQPDLIK